MPDSKPKTVRVRMKEGLTMPAPSGVMVDSALTVLTPETPVEVLWSRYARRRLASGDWVLVDDPDNLAADLMLEVPAGQPVTGDGSGEPLPPIEDGAAPRESGGLRSFFHRTKGEE